MLKNRLIRIVSILVIMPVIGTLGFMFIESHEVIDAIYMSIITLSTVGFGLLKPLSDPGKIFVSAYIVSSLGVSLYGITILGEAVLNGEIGRYLRTRQEAKRVQGLKNHHIVCGAGRMGRNISMDLAEQGLPFVIIENDERRAEEMRELGYSVVCGDASHDETLRLAGIERAKSLAAVLGKDADNVFVIISSKLLNAKLPIIARATDDEAAIKLRKAGAHKVVSPYSTVAASMVEHMRS